MATWGWIINNKYSVKVYASNALNINAANILTQSNSPPNFQPPKNPFFVCYVLK